MKKKENEVDTSKKNNKKRNIILVVVGLVLLAIVIFLLWFFNRKFEVTFDYNNGTENEIVLVKYKKNIEEKDIKTKEDLGEKFINWYLVIEEKDGKDVLDDKPFDFDTKINEEIKLKAVYEGKVETITITFDSKGGSKVSPITINKGGELTLPKDPTYKGYTFKGWTDKNGTPVYNKAKLNESATLYAKWEKAESKTTTGATTTTTTTTTITTTAKKEEKITLVLNSRYIHRNGYNTRNAYAKTENASGDVTFSVSSDRCLTIDSKTGKIQTKYVQKQELTYCAGGETITVTATLPSGKKASQTLILEKDLMLTVGNYEFTYVDKNRNFTTGTNDFKVKANQNVKWSTSGTVDGSVLTNDTTCSGKVNVTTSRAATITAVTTGGQKLDIYCNSVNN